MERRQAGGKSGSGLLSALGRFRRLGSAPVFCFQQLDYILRVPNMTRNSSGHSRGYAQRLVNFAEVVVHVMEGNCCRVILQFLRKCIGEAGKPAHMHSHCEVLPFNVGRGDVVHVGITGNNLGSDSKCILRGYIGFRSLPKTSHKS
jgi:hypothetical protein